MPEWTIPPLPDLALLPLYVGCAAAIVVGAAMVAWGRLLAKPLVMLALAGAGYLWGPDLGAAIQEWIKPWKEIVISPLVAQFVAVFVGLALGYVLERLLWPVMLAAMVSVPTAVFMMAGRPRASIEAVSAGGVAVPPAVETIQTWAQSLATGSYHALRDACTSGIAAVVAAVSAAVVVPLVLGVLLPRLMRRLMTALVGSAMIVGALLLAVSKSLPAFWTAAWEKAYIMVAIVVALAIVGMVKQRSAAPKAEPAKAESAKK